MPHVLYVEDDKASRDILTRLLRHLKLEVDVVETAGAALEQLAASSYNMLVVDLALPEVDGWTLVQSVRDDPRYATLKIAALTAHYDPSVVQQAKQAGFVTCLPKPANLQTAQTLAALVAE